MCRLPTKRYWRNSSKQVTWVQLLAKSEYFFGKFCFVEFIQVDENYEKSSIDVKIAFHIYHSLLISVQPKGQPGCWLKSKRINFSRVKLNSRCTFVIDGSRISQMGDANSKGGREKLFGQFFFPKNERNWIERDVRPWQPLGSANEMKT